MTKKQLAEEVWGAPQPEQEKLHGLEMLCTMGTVDEVPLLENEVGVAVEVSESLAEQLWVQSTALLRRLSQCLRE